MANDLILYGGPVAVDLEQNVQSLGEYIIKQLAGHGDKVSIVSRLNTKYT